jgi:hypothetical protein
MLGNLNISDVFNPSTVDEKLDILDIAAKKNISKIKNAYSETNIF